MQTLYEVESGDEGGLVSEMRETATKAVLLGDWLATEVRTCLSAQPMIPLSLSLPPPSFFFFLASSLSSPNRLFSFLSLFLSDVFVVPLTCLPLTRPTAIPLHLFGYASLAPLTILQLGPHAANPIADVMRERYKETKNAVVSFVKQKRVVSLPPPSLAQQLFLIHHTTHITRSSTFTPAVVTATDFLPLDHTHWLIM